MRTRCKRSEEHTSELQSLTNLVCRLLLEKKNVFSPRHTRRPRPGARAKRAAPVTPRPYRDPARRIKPAALQWSLGCSYDLGFFFLIPGGPGSPTLFPSPPLSL